jgi:O-antigen/teichoic acid export membrane protein
LKDSFSFSAQTLVSALTIPLLQTVVGAKFGSQANGVFDASRRVLFAARSALEAVFVPVFAHATRLVEAGDRGKLRRLAVKVTVASAVGALVLYGVWQ